MSTLSSSTTPAPVSAYRVYVLQQFASDTAKLQQLFKQLNRSECIPSLTESETTIGTAAARALHDVKLEVFHAATQQLSSAETLLRFDLPVLAIASLADEIIARSKAIEDAVAAVPESERSVENVLEPLINQDRILSPISSSIDFLAHVDVNKAIRDASTEADKKMTAYFVDSGMRVDVFKAVLSLQAKAPELEPEQRRAMEFIIRDFRRSGLELDEAKRARITAIKKEMSHLKIEFQRNLGEENTTMELSREQLDGLPESFLEKLPRTQDKFVLSLKYPEAFPVLKLCKVSETRKQLEFLFNSRCKEENTAIIERLVSLRDEQAKILGYKDHAHYVLELRMAKTPANVKTFLNDLSGKLEPLVKKEMDALLALKAEECAVRGEENDGRINMWDFRYYLNQREEKEYNVDHEELKKYFPLQIVTEGMFKIYQDLLCLRFKEVHSPKVWHTDVRLFEVIDTRSDELVGHFYLDLHPRAGKYGHAAVFGLQAQCDGQKPAAAMVANFSKPSDNAPSLLRHTEVVTFFHEFGHVMHQLCSRVKCARFSGTRVERDFVECPSQMLENWCWERDTLMMMCGHVDDPSVKLPDDMLDKLVKSKDANAGLLNRRQILFGLFDQTIHSQPEANTAEILSKMQEDIMHVPMTANTNFAASFGHLAGGYDASYYGYMYSEVFAMDMFDTRFKSEGLLSPSVGLDYRNIILARGGSVDAIELLREFLGRDPNQDAFLRSKGL